MSSPENRSLHTWTTEIATSANMNKLPRGWYGRAYNGSNQTISTTGSSVAITDCSVTVDLKANRVYKIEAQATVTAGVGTTSWIGEIRQGGTVIGRWGRQSQAPALEVVKSSGWVYIQVTADATATFDMSINTDVVAIVSGGGVNIADITVTDCGAIT